MGGKFGDYLIGMVRRDNGYGILIQVNDKCQALVRPVWIEIEPVDLVLAAVDAHNIAHCRQGNLPHLPDCLVVDALVASRIVAADDDFTVCASNPAIVVDLHVSSLLERRGLL
ncbi:MAG TPA: hypothetical protein VIV12_30430 [Streptosporangiaceae bacterium]